MKSRKSLAAMTTVGVLVLSMLLMSAYSDARAEGWWDSEKNFFNLAPEQGITFERVNFTFNSNFSASLEETAWGRISIDKDDLFPHKRMSCGYINVFTDEGWVVQNLPVDLGDEATSPAMYFNLGAVNSADTLSAHVEFSLFPLHKFKDGPRTEFTLGDAAWNAQGASELETETVGAPPEGNMDFSHKWLFRKHKQKNQNVQAAINQCVTMAMANSLQYLENRYGLPIPNDHDPGVKGDDTLVGQLDTATDRIATSRTSGSGLWFVPWLEGKFEYLAANGLADEVVHKHQGRGWGGAGQAIPDGDFTSSGITSTDEGDTVSWDWICKEVKRGEDVEIAFSYDDASGVPTGGHAVRVFACGRTFGQPWIGYLHDSVQSDDNAGLEQVFVFTTDTDNDGMLNIAPNWEIRFALSESVVPKRKFLHWLGH
jgi:hypothetical protein